MKSAVLILIFFCTGLSSVSIAQHLPVTVYKPRNGAMVNGAIHMFQDKTGWMWFTTGYNVVRYDGNSFKIYEPSKNTKLNFCYQVLQVGHDIWVLSNPYPLKVSGDSLYPHRSKDHPHFFHILDKYVLTKDGLYILDKEKLLPFITDSSLSFNHSRTKLFRYDSSLLVTFQPGEFIIFNLIKRSFQKIHIPVLEMQQGKDGQIYMLLQGEGIVRLSDLSFLGRQANYRLETMYRTKDFQECGFTIDNKKSIWFFKRFKSLTKISAAGEQIVFTEKDGLPNLWFNQLFTDKEGNVWIACNRELCKISNTSSERYTKSEGLSSDHIVSVSNDNSNRVFISTTGGLSVFNNGKINLITHKGKPFVCKQIIQVHGDYFFVRDSFLCKLGIDLAGYSVNSVKCFSLPGQAIQLSSDSRGNVYIATTKGLWLYNGTRLTKAINDEVYYRYLLIDKTDKLWIGEFGGGLHGYQIQFDQQDPALKKFIFLDTTLGNGARLWAIRSISTDDKNDLVVGTRYDGLFQLNFSERKLSAINQYDEKNGLNSNNIWDTDIDSTGNYWIATSKGLSKLSFENEKWIIKDEGNSRHIYTASHVFTAGNTIWVGNYPGIVLIKRNTEEAEPFSVFITGSSMNGKSVDISEPGKYNHRDNNLSFEFSANSFVDEGGVLYSYYLKGSKFQGWSQPSTSHTLNFSSLSPGNYELKIKAVNANGQWSQNEAIYGFVIRSPFWQQAWFIAIVFFLISLGLYVLYRYRINRLREMFEMRNIIARDLHDEIGSTLTSINILSKVSQRNLKKENGKAAELLQKVVDQSQQIQQNMSDIVWAVRPDNDRMENMTARMREYLSHTLEPKNIHIEFSADESIMHQTLSMQQRRDFFLIFKEAVNNVAKYSDCNQTQILLTRQNGHINLIIQDDGKGFDVNQVGSSGLKNMRHRASLLRGTLSISSSPGRGTRIELSVPAT